MDKVIRINNFFKGRTMMKKLLLMMAILATPAMATFAQDSSAGNASFAQVSTGASNTERGLNISGEVTVKGYVGPFEGQDQSGASLGDDDTYLRFTYNFSEYSGAQMTVGFDLKMNTKPGGGVTMKDAYGWSDILGEMGMNDVVGLKISMGILQDDGGIRNRHFYGSKGLDFGFESGDGIYGDTGSATDSYSWRLDIPMNFMKDVFPLNLGVTSDLDFSRKNGGHSTIVELSSSGMKLADSMVSLNWNVYYQNFTNAHNNGVAANNGSAVNKTFDYDFMAVGGSVGADMVLGDSFLVGVGTAMTWQEQRNIYVGGIIPTNAKRYDFDMMAGIHAGMVNIFDLHFAFMGTQANDARSVANAGLGFEDKMFNKNWLALRANFLMIPKVMIFGGMGIGLSDTIQNKISYEVGVRFDPIDNLNFMVGWQAGSDELGSIEAVQETVQGAIYVRGTWTF